MNVAFYFDDSQRYGDFTNEIKGSTNTHYAWCWRYAAQADDPVATWLFGTNGLVESCGQAVDAGRKIHLNVDLTWPTPLDTVFNALKPLRKSVVAVEIADEPKWNLAATNKQCQSVRAAMKRTGFGPHPIGIVYSTKQFPVPPGKIKPYDAVDWIGVEAYLEPPGDKNSPYNVEKITDYLYSALFAVDRSGKQCVVIPMSYSRNGAWRYLGTLKPASPPYRQAVKTLVDLQMPITRAALAEKRCIGLNYFSWARDYGARSYAGLAAEVLRCGKIAIK